MPKQTDERKEETNQPNKTPVHTPTIEMFLFLHGSAFEK
jgi:hypothetical protein